MGDVGGGGRWLENQYNTVCEEVGLFLIIFIRLSTIILFRVVRKFGSRQLCCQSEWPVQGYFI